MGILCNNYKYFKIILVIEKQSRVILSKIAAKFEELRGFPYVIGLVDESHILIIAPPTSYYYRIYSILFYFKVEWIANASFKSTILDGLDIIMIGLCSKILILGRK